MSHQTGITANQNLTKFFKKCKEGKIRLVKVQIVNEELSLVEHASVNKDWEKDFDVNIKKIIEPANPCFILYRLDTKMSLGYNWLLLTWIPDEATIRLKMLYASTKSTLKTEFGSSYISEELHATTIEETTLKGYYANKKAFSAANPLTSREEEIELMKKTEVKADYGTETRQKTMAGINFPLSEATRQAILEANNGTYNYLQFRIDLEEESIHLSKAANIQVSELAKQVPTDTARYHIFFFKYTHEGEYNERFIFVYSMPGYTCSIKERMMYSSSKSHFLDTVADLGLNISKKLEIDNGDELTEKFLMDELHPKQFLHKTQFSKPKGPPNRGAKRLTKTVDE